MKTAASVAGILALGALVMTGDGSDNNSSSLKVDDIEVASVSAAQQVFVLSGAKGFSDCHIQLSKSVSDQASEIEVGESCSGLYEDLSTAQIWQENKDGSIVLTDEVGNEIVSFGFSDGFEYEVVSPSHLMLKISQSLPHNSDGV